MLNIDLKFYKSLVVNNLSTNGGRMAGSTGVINTGELQNVFPHVFKAEREAGSTLYRKILCKNADDADGTLFSGAFCIDGNTLGDDWVCFWVGTQRDTQADITGSERKYGGGLSTTVITGGTTTTVTVEVKSSTMTGVFVDGDQVRISNKATPDSLTGTEQWMTITGTPTVVGSEVTMTFTAAPTDTYAVGAKVSSIYEPGDITTSLGTITETSSAGTYNTTTAEWILDNIGTTDEDLVFTFTDSTHFTCVGDSLGTLGSGIIGTEFVVTNSSFSKPRFTVPAGFFTGTWATGETLSRTIHPSAVALWEKKVTPAGASSISNNKITLIMSGEAI
jgi:hypothetical protein